ncbi:hypothetical protein [Paenibacillus sp. LPE1-1-1.1]|uniref:hypothetical protein n=1 Tax=Paenibacillus sp. LPE1-1-1.1 TaxID=3135230 RepID=UPI00341CD8FB
MKELVWEVIIHCKKCNTDTKLIDPPELSSENGWIKKKAKTISDLPPIELLVKPNFSCSKCDSIEIKSHIELIEQN